MFIVSKDGLSVREPIQVSVSMRYNKEIEDEAQKIYNSIIMDNMTHKIYARNEAEEFAERKAIEHIKEKSVYNIILDGEFRFGDYNEVQAKIVFEKILAALKNGERFFDMREVESGEDSQCD